MRLTHIFATLIVLLLALCGLLLFHSTNQDTAFYVAEGMVVAAILFVVLFYRFVLRPLKAVANGISLLKSQDYSTRLRHVGQFEADRIIDTFNPLIEELRRKQILQQEQNHLFNLIMEASPLAVVMVDENGCVTMHNSMAAKLLGDELSTKRLTDIDNRLAAELHKLDHNGCEIVRLSDAEIYRCSRLSFMDNGFVHPFYTIEVLTAEVAQAERKAYERVIRQMAHEVNNTICGVKATLDAVKSMFENDDSAGDAIAAIDACCEHSTALSSFISRYAEIVKIPAPSLTVTDINSLIASSSMLLDSICSKAKLCFKANLDPSPFIVNVDVPMMEQVLVNIVKNSVESPDATWVEITSDSIKRTITVTDNGSGVSPETAAHLFSPFYTTKASGQGLGLTLISHILRDHECRFSLATSPTDKLTRFIITFPR